MISKRFVHSGAKRLLLGGLFLGICYGGVASAVFAFQGRFIYYPTSAYSETPDQRGLRYQSHRIPTVPGHWNILWEIEPIGPQIGTLLYLHGNAKNVSKRLETYEVFSRKGIRVLALDYRGYGKSSGSPSEKAIQSDLAFVAAFIQQELQIPIERLWVYGRSLGGAIAIEFASRFPPEKLVLESTFTSIVDMGRKKFPLLPVSFLVRQKFDSIRKIQSISVPKLHLHSQADQLIPYSMGRQLFEKAAPPKEFFEISGSHNVGIHEKGSQFLSVLMRFLEAKQ